MPLDAVTISAVARELRDKIIGCKIDKVHQPEKDEIILALRGAGGSSKLLLSGNQQNARLHILSENRDNPPSPPMFCMLMRKYIGGGIIRAVNQPPLERLIELEIDTMDEMGQPHLRKLILELIGRQSNLILADEDGRITDSLRRVDGDLAEGKRQILPGMFYRYPEAQQKRNYLEMSGDELRDMVLAIPEETRLDKWLLDTFFGISPLISREIAFRAAGDTEARMDSTNRQAFLDALTEMAGLIKEERFQSFMLLKEGRPFDLSFTEIRQYGGLCEGRQFASFSEMAEHFYSQRERKERLQTRASDIKRNIKQAADRLRRKLETQKKEYEQAKQREHLRQAGDLLMANIYSIKRGQPSITVANFYDESNAELEITLSPKLSPQENAAKYYKDYARMKNAEKYLSQLIADGEKELAYLESVLNEFENCESAQDVQEIRNELEQTGYVKSKSQKKAGFKQKKSPKQKAGTGEPREFTSTEGYTILVGRNNLQNDALTKEAHRGDIWLHVQRAHGSHVIIRCAGEEPDEATYTQAARLAAFYSEFREGQNVPVDYTRVKNVKKPAGARPGMVVYDPYFTAYVTPSGDEAQALRV